MSFRPPVLAREGGPTPGTGSSSVSAARSPVSDEHVVQFYEDDAQLVDVVATFLAGALVRGRYRVVGDQIARLAERFSRVRAFGEMVGLLVDGANTDAVLGLEAMWNALLDRTPAELLCAYPAASIESGSGAAALEHIRAARTSAPRPS